MQLPAFTRSVVARTHAILTPNGFSNSNVPNWTGCTVNVLVNERLGAGFGQMLITARENGQVAGRTTAAQIFFYVVRGECQVAVGGTVRLLKTGQFVYVPIEQEYLFDRFDAGTQLLTFHKKYEPLAGHLAPEVLFGEQDENEARPHMSDEGLRIQELLPQDPAFDMAVNIFTYDPGAFLPTVETHSTEHGLLYLQGQAICLLNQQYYPVQQGDAIWMAPHCPQWVTSIGKEPSVYIYYKNVNRFPTVV
ncbi:(S)-ureidoglycine aminohydrolase [Hymenobacter aerilatus]|uniref:(S)-ureidoglycine aminohydrolase n=1 Tax=Hymenobacter aerilatus TaxID=2932251 RepID=A0A8T9SQR4_9BACT|nr:(S)-ureidoglycine aminohydrolase [Hymenobacter aerilatus]UOR03691.1 (S)-ureidoglycine aminohydrolase [Hymenobacter aerilatus]